MSSHGNSGGPVIAAIQIAHGAAAYRGGIATQYAATATRPWRPWLNAHFPRFSSGFLVYIFVVVFFISHLTF